jgi:antitoxin MazE
LDIILEPVVRVKVAKWGNSVAVRLPRAAVEALHISPGRELNVTVEGGEVFLRPVSERRAPTLEELVAKAKQQGPAAQPPLVDWGPDVGAEVLPDD